MTALLEKAVHTIHKLPDEDQDAIAALIFEEIDSEKKWDQLFSSSQAHLAKMASVAIAEYKAGRTKTLDIDRDL
jgi:predicted transcriptional regulator